MSVVVVFIFHVMMSSSNTHATNVKWTSANEHGTVNDPAKTAPKSQKYWDEHNIERPDYAKTDAEIMAERLGQGGGGGATTIIKFVAFLVAAAGLGCFVILPRIQHGKGQTLSGRPGMLSPLVGSISKSSGGDQATVARQARLSRFEKGD